MKKTALAVPLVLMCLLALVLIFTSPVKAQEPLNLTIKPDGSVEPNTNLLEGNGNTYIFNDDIFGTIWVQTNNIVIDGAGHTLQANGDTLVGINIEGRSNVTVRNIVIQGFLGRAGILVTGSNNCIISKNNLEGNLIGVEISGLSSNNRIVENNLLNNTSGIELESAVAGSNNIISGNDVTNNNVGITLTYFANTDVFGNTLTDNKYGFFVGGSAGSVLRNNTLNGNTYGFHVFNVQGITALKGVDVDTSNKVNGKPIYYWVNQHDRSIPIDAGYVALIGCTNVTVSNLNLSDNAEGVYLGSTENSAIINNSFSNNLFGVSLDASNNNTISKNIIANNENGIGLGAGLGRFSSNNVIDLNVITGNGNGIYFGAAASNIVTRNIITNSATAIYTEYSGINILYNNNFINNTNQWFDIVLGSFPNVFPISVSTWDNGTAGNYWSDYLAKYPNATEIDASGIGDTPYVIYNNNTDRFPLMKPFSIPEIAIPEFPSLIILPLFAIATLLMALLYFKRHKRGSVSSLS